MKARIPKEIIISEVARLGLSLEEQAAYFKVERPPYVLHFAKTQRVSRIHLKGFNEISHPAIRRVSPKEARERHLGNVSAELDNNQPEDVFRDGVMMCLRVMAGLDDAKRLSRARRDEAVQMTISLERDLVQEIDSVAPRIPVPPGIQVAREDAVRYLLHLAIEAMRLKEHLLAMPDVGRDEDFVADRSIARRVDL